MHDGINTMGKIDSVFYKKSAQYWAKMPATLDGVLGGYEYVSDIDIKASKKFLDEIFHAEKLGNKLALDCGAGIGRVTKYLLINKFRKVDLVEQDEKFINRAKTFIGQNNKVGTLYMKGLQHFKPEKKYNLIWCQWVLAYLNDYDLLGFLERCRGSLTNNGVIIVKENVTSANDIEFDEDDSSVTRSSDFMKTIFNEADLEVIKEAFQPNLPEELYPVKTFALKPKLI